MEDTPAVDKSQHIPERLLRRHQAWWQHQGMLYAQVPHTPLSSLWLPLVGGTTASQDMDVRPDMLDLAWLAGEPLEPGPLILHGDAMETRAPYGRIPWVEAILGCPVRATIQGGSMRAHAVIRDWGAWWSIKRRWDDEWFQALTQLTEMLVARSGGRYAVVQTLMRGPSDLAEAILGPELMCLSMYDHPRDLQRFLAEVTEAFIEIHKAQQSRIPRLHGGSVNPFGIWCAGTTVRTQCDASAFLSPKQYAEWFLPYDAHICETVDYAVIHLHSGSLHTVDALLAVEKPQAIQITLDPEPSAPPVEALLDTFEKILGVKSLIVDGPLSTTQVQLLQERLPHDGLYISARQGAW